MGLLVLIGIGREQDKQKFRFFYTLPVQRLFRGRRNLDNEAKFDKEHEKFVFGVLYTILQINCRGSDQA